MKRVYKNLLQEAFVLPNLSEVFIESMCARQPFLEYAKVIYTCWRRSMRASVVDLRYWMNETPKTIDRNEEVTILYHGNVKGYIKPKIPESRSRITDHSFFSMYSSKKSVKETMADLSGARFEVQKCRSEPQKGPLIG